MSREATSSTYLYLGRSTFSIGPNFNPQNAYKGSKLFQTFHLFYLETPSSYGPYGLVISYTLT